MSEECNSLNESSNSNKNNKQIINNANNNIKQEQYTSKNLLQINQNFTNQRMNNMLTPSSSQSHHHHHHRSGKQPRMRTVMNEKQLNVLRSYYMANPRPDAALKEHLVELTGLSPRVIRVWFQNKRCKDKKKSVLGGRPTDAPPLCLPSVPFQHHSIMQQQNHAFNHLTSHQQQQQHHPIMYDNCY
jgi:hypothetical protein